MPKTSNGRDSFSDALRATINSVLRPGRFFVARPLKLRIEHVEREEIAWELFRGHLLDRAHARQIECFESWHVFLDPAEAPAPVPLISVKYHPPTSQIHIVRQIFSHGFEAYEDLPGVILSRPVQKWVAELAGTIELESIAEGGPSLMAELSESVFLAVIGANRLPITSIEAPLPAFSLGQFSYLPGLTDEAEPWTDPIAFLTTALDDRQSLVAQAKGLETALRAVAAEQLLVLVDVLEQHRAQRPLGSEWLMSLLGTVFNQVALSPYTEFADRLVALLRELATPSRLGAETICELLGRMLRHLVRHLTAFDLTLFHNFGANYPDALFLDALLKTYLELIDADPKLLLDEPHDTPAIAGANRRRRRVLRQGGLLRQQYEGHRVPDAPTSMGESLRVLPAPFMRVPEEQITQVSKRRRKLFENDLLVNILSEITREALEASMADLQYPLELRELGMAYFLDRPLGIFKEPGEIDRTPLLSYEAFSRTVAQQRLARLKADGWVSKEQHALLLAALKSLAVSGVPSAQVLASERPGVVSLADARNVASDFIFIRTTRGSLTNLISRYCLQPLAEISPQTAEWLTSTEPVLLYQHVPLEEPHTQATLKFHDRQGVFRLELGFDVGADRMVLYCQRNGAELAHRLQVLRVADASGCISNALPQSPVWIEA